MYTADGVVSQGCLRVEPILSFTMLEFLPVLIPFIAQNCIIQPPLTVQKAEKVFWFFRQARERELGVGVG